MVSDSALIELKNIIASEYKVILSMTEVRLIAESLMGLFSVFLRDNKSHQSK